MRDGAGWEGVGGPPPRVGVPSVQAVSAYQSPITRIYRDAPARDDSARLTALERQQVTVKSSVSRCLCARSQSQSGVESTLEEKIDLIRI